MPAGESNHTFVSFLQRIDPSLDELDTLRGSYMQACKGPRGTITEVMAEASEAGFAMKAFRQALTDHKAERRRRKKVAAMEDEARDAYERYREEMGDFADTPLGTAAGERVRDGASAHMG